jgi:sulfate/thiosulfate transport system substrate-binding protein
VEHVNPTQTFKIENPLAVVSTSSHLDAATAFKNFQYTAEAQKLWAQAGFRPVDPAVADKFRDQYPVPVKLWTIADLGGWSKVDAQLFDRSGGSITKVYLQATG